MQREYITNELKLEQSRLWNVPYRKNIYKQFDEVNRCTNIVTDDLFIMNISYTSYL